MSGANMKGSLTKLYKDPRVVYTLLWLSLVIPFLAPMGLPISISTRTQKAYSAISALRSGDVIMFSVDVNAGAWGELGAGATVLAQHLFKTPGIKIVIVSFDQQGPLFADRILKAVNRYDKEYGKDYVLLGFVPGEKAVGGAALANDIPKVFQKDFYGASVESLPMMKNIRSYKDITLIVDVDWGVGTEAFLYQWVAPYKSKLLALMTNQMAPTFEPHYNAGNLVALVVGIRGAAEYELITGIRGVGIATTDALSVSHLLVIFSIFAGNIVYFAFDKRRK